MTPPDVEEVESGCKVEDEDDGVEEEEEVGALRFHFQVQKWWKVCVVEATYSLQGSNGWKVDVEAGESV